MEIIMLTPKAPKYFSDAIKSAVYHNESGGYLWKRKEGIGDAYPEFAANLISPPQLAVYELHAVNGRVPSETDIQDVEKLVHEYQAQNDYSER